MMLSESAVFSGASWVSYQNPTTFEISAGDGAKSVYYKLRDAVLNPSVTVEANITLDTSPPTVDVFSPHRKATLIGGTTAEIEWQASDSASGIADDGISISYSTNEGTDNYPYPVVVGVGNTGSYGWQVPYLNGKDFKIKVQATDRANNSASEVSEEDFFISTILSVITITYPGSGDVLRGGMAAEISYVVSSEVGWATPISLWSSTQGSTGWPVQPDKVLTAPDIDGAYTTSWDAPKVNSTTCFLSMEAEDRAGRAARALSAQFAIDSTTPEVSDIVPPDESEDVETDDTSIVIKFSEPMDRGSVHESFTVSPEVRGTFGWSDNDMTLTFTPEMVLRGDTDYRVTIGAGAKDKAGNPIKEEIVSEFRTAAPIETIPPRVVITINGVTIESWKGRYHNYIPDQPTIEALATDNFQIDSSGVTLFLDNEKVTSAVIQSLSITSVGVEYAVPVWERLEAGTHSVKVEAIDAAGNVTVKEVGDLEVTEAGEETKLDFVITYPNTFAPGKGETASFAYVLNKDTDITIYVYSPVGRVSWTRKYPAGSVGGQAGYNAVVFDGISDISGAPLANGIYVFRVIERNKVLGTGYIVVFD
jgi:hypothetical protein